MKIVKKNQLKIVIFTAVKNRCILHRCVFVMVCSHDLYHFADCREGSRGTLNIGLRCFLFSRLAENQEK